MDEAIAQFKEALRIKPASVDAQNNLGTALFQQGKTEEAIAHFKEALRLNPGGIDARNNLGNALLEQGRMEEAIDQYRGVLKLAPGNANAHYNLGNALLEKKQAVEAATHFREALRINPGNADAQCNLGFALFLQGRTGEAIEQAKKGLEQQPANAAIQNILAWMLTTAPEGSLRDGARAVELATKASQSNGAENNPVILRTLAAAYAETGRFAEALETARKALHLAETQSNAKVSGELSREIKLYEAGRRCETTEL
jgi:tetratricopeptide (TPR) repeat protein